MTVSDMNIGNDTAEADEELTVKQQWGKAIRAQRLFVGMSQSALAKAIGVDQSAVSGWESGSKSPDPDRWLAIADALKIDPGVLFQLPRRVAS